MPITSVDKYSPSTNTWSEVDDMFDQRTHYCVCAFMDKIFVIGGFYDEGVVHNVTNSCLQFDTKHDTLIEVSGMNEVRFDTACAVFEGNIVVAGGLNIGYNKLRRVESYDVIANEWSPMPNMIKCRTSHQLVVVKNKLFVIGNVNKGCEVYEKTFKKFVQLKSPLINGFFLRVIAIGSKIIVFGHYKTSAICYDVDTNEWSREPCDVSKNMSGFSSVKVPWF